MFEISIDNEILDEVNELLDSGKLTQWLASNTVNIESVALILTAITEKIDEVRKELNG